MITTVECKIENEMQALCIACVVVSADPMFVDCSVLSIC